MVSLPIYHPIQFGPAERRLFGIYQAADTATSGSPPAILLCNPFGQEAIRAHRFLRTLADRLSRFGHPVLRFDYFGTGDSLGDDADGEIDGWSRDVLAAHDELMARSRATTAIWIGMRLGAAVSLRAARNAPASLVKLILWDPVLDGRHYLAYLRERHIASLESVFPIPLNPSPRHVARKADAYPDEALGFALSPTLRTQLAELRQEEHRWPLSPPSIVVITDPDTPDGHDFVQLNRRNPGRAQVLTVRHGTNWTTDSAANTSLVPGNALLAISQQAGGKL